MNTYVVCMDSSWVRDSQMFDIAVIKAENEEEACKKAGSQMRYDPRCLYAIKVSG